MKRDINRKRFEEIREGAKRLIANFPELGDMLKKMGFLKLENGVDIDSGRYSLQFKMKGGDYFYPIEEIPTVFMNCIGITDCGTIAISDLIFYRYEVANRVLSMYEEYNNILQLDSIYILPLLNRDSFDVNLFIPKAEDKNWSRAKKLQKEVCSKLSDIFLKISKNISDCEVFVCKLHMNKGTPVLSLTPSQFGNTDYGLTRVILSEYNFLIKEVYFIVSQQRNCEFDSVIAKKNKDGEYTLSIY